MTHERSITNNIINQRVQNYWSRLPVLCPLGSLSISNTVSAAGFRLRCLAGKEKELSFRRKARGFRRPENIRSRVRRIAEPGGNNLKIRLRTCLFAYHNAGPIQQLRIRSYPIVSRLHYRSAVTHAGPSSTYAPWAPGRQPPGVQTCLRWTYVVLKSLVFKSSISRAGKKNLPQWWSDKTAKRCTFKKC